jgi:peroxiredoxin Q/BCP
MKKIFSILSLILGTNAHAAALKVGDGAPNFSLQTNEGKPFELNARKGAWTVLYFYPKAETPGCTKQACAFRDSIKVIRDLGADIFGVSVNTVAEQAGFHEHHHLNFALLADVDAKVAELYGVKMPVMKMAKRWTFIIGPDLKIKYIEQDVDPVKDAENVAQQLRLLQAR